MPKHPLLSQAQHHTYVITVILSLSKVILLYSHCVKKGLVYITIAAPSSHQPLSYAKYTYINIRSLYDVHSVSNAKYTPYIRRYLRSSYSGSRNTQYYIALLALLFTL